MFKSISPWISCIYFHIVCCSKGQTFTAFGLNFGHAEIRMMDEKGCCAIDLEVDALSQ